MKKLKITDKERKGMKGRRIAFGICAAVLGTAGIGTLLPESVGAYAESYVDENGNDVIKTYPSDPSQLLWERQPRMPGKQLLMIPLQLWLQTDRTWESQQKKAWNL